MSAMEYDARARFGMFVRAILTSIEVQSQLAPQLGVTWFRFYIASNILLALISGYMFETWYAVAATLSSFAIVVVGLWWKQFVGGLCSIASLASIRLTPHVRRMIFLLFVCGWLFVSALMAAALVFYQWFFIPVVLIALASSIRDIKWRERGIFLVCGIVLMAAIWLLFIYGSLPFRDLDDQVHRAEVWLGLVGAVACLVGILSCWVAFPFVGYFFLACAYALYIFVLTRELPNKLQVLIDALTQHTGVVLVLGVCLFAISLYALVGKRAETLSRSQAEVKNIGFQFASTVKYLSWRRKWGYDYFLSLALRRANAARTLIPYGFGRSVHWTSMTWMILFFGFMFVSVLFIDNYQTNQSEQNLAAMCAQMQQEKPTFSCPTPPPESPRSLIARMQILSSLMFISMVSLVTVYSSNIWRTRREQALMKLTPNWPTDRALNERLAAYFLAVVGGVLCLNLIVLAATALWFTRHNEFSMGLLIVMLKPAVITVICVALAVFFFMMRRYDAMEKEKENPFFSRWVGLVMWPLALPILNHNKELREFPLLEVSLAVYIGIIVWRYHQYIRSPSVLPAGRQLE